MTTIINKPFYEEFLKLCSEAKESINLCSPFVKLDIVKDILAIKNVSSKIKLITKINLRSFYQKASDIEAVAQLINNNYSVKTLSKLHAKVYIFDSKTCVITSANLTTSGLKRNFEYGIISENKALVATAVTDYESLFVHELTGKIETRHIEQTNKILNSLPPLLNQNLPKFDLNSTNEVDEDVFDKDKIFIINNLENWNKALFLAIDNLPYATFSTSDFPILVKQLQPQYPNNNTIEAKIRQILQHLRDFGLVQFVSPGKYKKLWI